MKKDEQGFIQGGMDPAVAAALSGGNQRREQRTLPRVERKRRIREKAKGDARKGQRALYDLPAELIAEVQAAAEEYGTSASQMAKLALWLFLRGVRDGSVDVRAYRVLAKKNPRYEYMIELAESEES